MRDDDGAFSVELNDDVLVHTQNSIIMQKGVSFGAWYVWVCRIGAGDSDALKAGPDETWTVGHQETGYAAWHHLTFHDAVRVARALDDAFPEIDLNMDDGAWVFAAVIGAALMDHYVFPIDRYVPCP